MQKNNSNNRSLWIMLFFVMFFIALIVFRSEKEPEVEFFAPPAEQDSGVRNEGTEHEFIVAEPVKPEVEPDLSESVLSVSTDGTIEPGATVRYTIDLFNIGNSDATDMDVFNELDISFEMPSAFDFDNCGDDPNYNAEEEGIEFSSVTVKQGSHCVINYDAVIKMPYVGDYRLTNNLYISPAAEGGEEVGPIFSDSLILGSSYEEPPLKGVNPTRLPPAWTGTGRDGQVDTPIAEEPEPCGECNGKIITLTLRYDGSTAVQAEVVQDKNDDVLFDATVQPGEKFSFVGTDKGTMGVKIYINGVEIHTSCSKDIYVGMIFGDFTVVEGESLNGGSLCEADENEDEEPVEETPFSGEELIEEPEPIVDPAEEPSIEEPVEDETVEEPVDEPIEESIEEDKKGKK